MNRNIQFKTSRPSPALVMTGVSFVVCGIIISSLSIPSGGVGILMGIIWLSTHEGVRFQLDKELYQVYFNILGVKLGRWQRLPDERFILLKKVSTTSRFQNIYGLGSRKEICYKIFLKSAHPKLSIELYAGPQPEQAEENAEEIAGIFSIELKKNI